MIAAKLANMSVGGDKKSSEYQTANLQNDNVSRAEAAKLLNISERTVNTAKKVEQNAIPVRINNFTPQNLRSQLVRAEGIICPVKHTPMVNRGDDTPVKTRSHCG